MVSQIARTSSSVIGLVGEATLGKQNESPELLNLIRSTPSRTIMRTSLRNSSGVSADKAVGGSLAAQLAPSARPPETVISGRGGQHARTGQPPGIDLVAEDDVEPGLGGRAADHRREAKIQHDLRVVRGPSMFSSTGISPIFFSVVDRRIGEMAVGVDQAGHQVAPWPSTTCLALALDRARRLWRRCACDCPGPPPRRGTGGRSCRRRSGHW